MDQRYVYDELVDEIAYDLYEKPYSELGVDEKSRVIDIACDAVDPD